jgi:aspartate/methionine/tyrosine aminotransferase
MAPAELELLVATAAAQGVLVIADETYDEFVYDGAAHASAAAVAARYSDPEST